MEVAAMPIHSPKRRLTARDQLTSWYNYYAGYSVAFVRDILHLLHLPEGAQILDPWNGSGTTTVVAHEQGYKAIGFDINPALVLVAKARLLGAKSMDNIESLTEDILNRARRYRSCPRALPSDSLELWFLPTVARTFRNIERAIQQVLIDRKGYTPLFGESTFDHISSLAAFFSVVLFQTLRIFLKPFGTSNLTWIKVPGDPDHRLAVDISSIEHLIRQCQNRLATSLRASNLDRKLYPQAGYYINLASSHKLPLSNLSVHAVITSPPYCTRIDYAIATLPELALLGRQGMESLKNLRDMIIGTPTMHSTRHVVRAEWGETCVNFLNRVHNHTSKASATYYLRYY